MIDRAGNLSTAQGHANPVIDENSLGIKAHRDRWVVAARFKVPSVETPQPI